MPDLADKLAHAFTLAATRAAAQHSSRTVAEARDMLADDLRRILSTDLPEWYAGYDAAQEDAAEAAAVGIAPPTLQSGDVLKRSTCRHCDVPVSLLHVVGGTPIWNHDPEGASRYAPCSAEGWANSSGSQNYVASGGTFAEPRPAPPYECPHGDPLCPCLGVDHRTARSADVGPPTACPECGKDASRSEEWSDGRCDDCHATDDPPEHFPCPPAVLLQHWIRDDGALVLSLKPYGEELLTRPVVVYLGDDVIVDDTAPSPRTRRSDRLNDERFSDYGPGRSPS